MQLPLCRRNFERLNWVSASLEIVILSCSRTCRPCYCRRGLPAVACRRRRKKRLQRPKQKEDYAVVLDACKLLVADYEANEALSKETSAVWLRNLGLQFRLDYGSRPLGTSSFDEPSVHCGLRNLGNSCWLNAVVQCLYHCRHSFLRLAQHAPH